MLSVAWERGRGGGGEGKGREGGWEKGERKGECRSGKKKGERETRGGIEDSGTHHMTNENQVTETFMLKSLSNHSLLWLVPSMHYVPKFLIVVCTILQTT